MNQKVEKPTLQGQRIKTRKRDEKEKYDAIGFRDLVVTAINDTGGDLDQISRYLDSAGNKLDYRRYAEPLFDILISGGLLGPGGVIVTDVDSVETFRTDHYALSSADDDASLRAQAQVFNKLIRRYKYLEKAFGDEMRKVLKFSKGFNNDERIILGKILGIFIGMGLAPPNVLNELLQDHLVKEGIAIQFACLTFNSWLSEKNGDSSYITGALRKAGLDNKLLELLPIHKRSQENLYVHLKEAGLEALVEFQKSQENAVVKKQLQKELNEMMASEESVKEMVSVVRDRVNRDGIPEHDAVTLVWSSIMSGKEWNKKEDLVTDQALKHIKIYCPILSQVTSKPRSELALMMKIQEYCYDHMSLMKTFSKIILLLYKAEILSEDTILQWYKTNQGGRGRSVFIEQMKKFVEWLKSAEEESEDDDDEEEG